MEVALTMLADDQAAETVVFGENGLLQGLPKDIRLALAAAHAADVPLPTASLLQDHALEGVANGMGDLDWSSLAKVAAMNAGLK